MFSRQFRALAVGLLGIAVLGCGYKYTKVLDESLKNEPIQPSTFVVFPIQGMQYSPPHSCMFPSDPSDRPVYESQWNNEVRRRLVKSFPRQKWIFIDPNGTVEDTRIDLDRVYAIAENRHASERVSKSVSTRTDYAPHIVDGQMSDMLKPVRDKTGAEYALIFFSSSLTGEVQTNYNPPMMGTSGMMMAGGSSQTTYYTSDIRVQVWHCSSGRLMYCSGAWEKESGFCIFFSPQGAAIRSATGSMLSSLHQFISRLLQTSTLPNIASGTAK